MPRKKKPTPVLGPLSGPRIVSPFIPKPVHFAPPKTFTNATSTEPYTPPRWNVRDGGDDHKQFPSLGV